MAISCVGSGFAFNVFTSEPMHASYLAKSSVDIGAWSNVGTYAVPRWPLLCLHTTQRGHVAPSSTEHTGRSGATILI